MKTCRLIPAALALLLACNSTSPALAEQPTSAPTSGPSDALIQSWLAPAEPLHIAGPINFVGTQGLAVYLITTPAGHILLGGAMPPSANDIQASIRKLGYDPRDIKILVVNHAHYDHVGTLAAFKKLTGASVAAMSQDVDLLASGGKRDYLFSHNPLFYFPPVTVDRPLKDGDTIELGDVKLTAHLTPGHTPGCAIYTTTITDHGQTYSVIFADGTGINPGTRFVDHPSYPTILQDYRSTFKTLESLHPDIFLAYHTPDFDFATKRPRAATEGAQAFVDPEGFQRFVAMRKANFEKRIADEGAKAP